MMNISFLKSTITAFAAVCSIIFFVSCKHTTLEDRAEKEAREFTERYCPTPVQDFQRVDSLVFDRSSHTFVYYYRLVGDADNAQIINKLRAKLRTALLDGVKGNTDIKLFKEKGYNFRYVFRSEKTKGILFEETFSKKDYKQ